MKKNSSAQGLHCLTVAMLGLCGWLLAGCGEKEDTASKPLTPKKPKPEAVAPDAATTTPPPPGGVQPAEATTSAPPPPFKYDVSDSLTMLVNQYRIDRGVAPASLNDLITAGYATKLPTPPNGKSFVIIKVNEKELRVQLR